MMKVTLISASSGKHVLRRDFALSLFVSDKLRYKKKILAPTEFTKFFYFDFPVNHKKVIFFLFAENAKCSLFAIC